MTIFLTISALVNIGLGYWLATYLAREKARASAVGHSEMSVDESMDSHAAHGEAVQSAPRLEMPPVTPAMPMMAQPLAAAAAPAAPAAVPPVAAPHAGETPAAPVTAAVEAPELETEVLAGIEEFRNQLAQMKAAPDAAPPVAASV